MRTPRLPPQPPPPTWTFLICAPFAVIPIGLCTSYTHCTIRQSKPVKPRSIASLAFRCPRCLSVARYLTAYSSVRRDVVSSNVSTYLHKMKPRHKHTKVFVLAPHTVPTSYIVQLTRQHRQQQILHSFMWFTALLPPSILHLFTVDVATCHLDPEP